jgi:hypothetical protein
MKWSILQTRSATETKDRLIEPAGVGWGEVEMPTRALREPGAHFGVLMRGIVIDNHMEVEFGWDIGLDMAQKRQELLMTMTRLALRQDRAIEEVEGGKQRGRAMALIVVGDPLDIAAHRQHGLGRLQRLDLALLVDAQDKGLVGRED